jgi:hypothetical protein
MKIHRHIALLAIWVTIIVILSSPRLWKFVRPQVITKYMNLLSLISFIFPMRLIAIHLYRSYQDPLRDWHYSYPPIVSENKSTDKISPDIYYIILDGYGRKDILDLIILNL